jgi:tetratricopeptide (TPR) repeat protein
VTSLALVCRKLGKHMIAERLYLEALAVRKLAFGTDDVRYIGMLDGRTALYEEIGNFAQAEARMQEAVEIVGRCVGRESAAFGSRLKRLAALYNQLGRTAEAVKISNDALVIYVAQFGWEHPETIETLSSHSLLQNRAGPPEMPRPRSAAIGAGTRAVNVASMPVVGVATGWWRRRLADP